MRAFRSVVFAAVVVFVGCQPAGNAPSEPEIVAGVTSRDAAGAPRFLWAASDTPHAPAEFARDPAGAAAWYVGKLAPVYEIDAKHVPAAARVHDTGRGGIVVTMEREVGGVPVFGEELKVLLRRDLSLVAVGGNLRPDAELVGRKALAADDAALLAPTLLPQGSALAEAPRVIEVLFPVERGLLPAYYVELWSEDATGNSVLDAFVLSAVDGRELERRSLTADVAFNYRVWADPTGDFRPLEGPYADFLPHPTGVPDGSAPVFGAPSMVSVESLLGPSDPWLLSNATETAGNNVDAYTDPMAPDGYSNGDLRATVNAVRTFDRIYDVAQEPYLSADQQMAAVTQMFFTTNWLHDWYYLSGFDEASGNMQRSNYGRGGEQSDYLRAEVQDNYLGGSRNNANAATPLDGVSPRIQMFLWQGVTTDFIELTPGGTVETGTAAFGPTDFDTTGTVVLAVDGAPPTSDLCTAPTVSLAGMIALADRGGCTFVVKATNAQNAGAIGIIIANNVAGVAPPGLGGTGAITIPVLSVTMETGNAIKASLMSGPVTARMFRDTAAERDGALDTMIVAHEWGHVLHHRLVSCGSSSCSAMSEGFGDFLALHLVVRETDDRNAAFAMGIYGTPILNPTNYGYFGIRRVPYSANPAFNALSFRHIANGEPLPATHPITVFGPNAEVHNAGEIWATMLFEAYSALVDRTAVPGAPYGFEEARRRMSDYLVAGMKLAPVEPTWTEMRDAILAAAVASDMADASAMAAAFAERGAGSCAVSPPITSTTFVGVVESTEVKPVTGLSSLTLADSVTSCDGDGMLDARETARVTVRVQNLGLAPLTGAAATITSTAGGITFPGGTTAAVPALAPFEATDVTFDVALSSTVTGPARFSYSVTISSMDACAPVVSVVANPWVDTEDVLASSATDGVESFSTPWSVTDSGAYGFTRDALTPANTAWHGDDGGSISDIRLESPDLAVTNGLSISLQHRYQFEFDGATIWDGGVVEVTTNGGVSWSDVTAYGISPGYLGAITGTSGNPLGGRNAFSNVNASYPSLDPLVLSFGSALDGRTVRIRFRIGTDAAVAAGGWDLDDIAVTGISNLPFPTLGPNTQECAPPSAVAQAVATDEDTAKSITLAGAGSGTLSYLVMTAPANGALSGTAPNLTYTPNANFAGDDSFTFVTNDGFANSDPATVTIGVAAVNDAPVAAGNAYMVYEDATALVDSAAGVLANDADVDSPFTAMLLQDVANGMLDLNADGSFTYTPDADFSGADVFVYRATDGALSSADATVTLIVGAVNDAPAAIDDSYTGTEDTPLVVDAASGVLSNDSDVDSTLTAVVVQQPAFGSIALANDGSFTYTPSADFAGVDFFTYGASDGTASAPASLVTVDVTPANDAPSLPVLVSPANAEILDDREADLAWTPSTDVDGDAITYHVVVLRGTQTIVDHHTTSAFANAADLAAGEYAWRVEATDGTASSGFTADGAFTVRKSGGGGGCGCSTASSAPTAASALLALVSLALLVTRRRLAG